MRTCIRTRAAWLALITAGGLLVASASSATRVEYLAPPGGSLSVGFDNSTLSLAVDFDIDNQWMSAGLGAAFAIQIFEHQTLRDTLTPLLGTQDQELNVQGSELEPWTSFVEWTVVNNSGLDGPAYLFFSGLQPFADATLGQYDHSNVGITVPDSPSAFSDFSVLRYQAQSADYFYLAFLIEDFSQPLTFEYEVMQDIIGFETDSFGTPILQMNAYFLPEPSASMMITVALIGLAYIGRRRVC